MTDGNEIHFAPGRFAPGTEQGDRLIAHELAHVAQQRQPGPPSPELAAELDADLAAESAVLGETPRLRASLAGNRAHAFEAWEHRRLGGAYGGEDRRIKLPNGAELTYGQIVALSGDFYRSPEALLRAPRSEVEAILRVMDREQAAAARSPTHAPTPDEANALNVAYELATSGPHGRPMGLPVPPLLGERDVAGGPHGEVREGEHVESGAPSAQAGFIELAEKNPSHFSPENIAFNWIPKHQLALDLARQAWQSRHPRASPAPILPGAHVSARAGTAAGRRGVGLPPTAAAAATVAPGRPDPSATRTPAGLASAESTASAPEQAEAQAWLASAFSDHFLTDAFAAGHLISGSEGRRIARTFFNANDGAITEACWRCAIADGMRPRDAAVVVPLFRSFLGGRAEGLLLKTVHDFYNRTGIEVRNALGQVWTTFGDANLARSPDAITMGELASKASRDAVQDVLTTGGTTRAEAALDYIPDLARLAAGAFTPVATFSTDLAVWTPVLNRALSTDPAVNDLYQLVKGNIGPIVGMYARKAGRWVRAEVREEVEDVQSLPQRLEREIYRLYGVPH